MKAGRCPPRAKARRLELKSPGRRAGAFFARITSIALVRGHHNGFAIFLTNLLLGWTVIGWVVAFIWSCTAIERRVTI